MKYSIFPLLLFVYSLILVSCKDDEPDNKPPETAIEVTTFAGGEDGLKDGLRTDARFHSPTKIALSPGGDIYVIDQDKTALRKINSSGSVSTIIADYPSEIVALVVGKDGAVFVAGYMWIGKLQADGSIEIIADALKMSSDIFFQHLMSMEMLPDGSLILFEAGNNRVINISTSGEVIAVLCSHPMGYQGGERNGKLQDIYFRDVHDLFVTNSGEIYFTDWLKHDLRKISADKMVTTIVGLDYASPFSFPVSITKSTEGSLYLIESNRIVKIEESGSFKTFAGGVAGYLDAAGGSAQFFGPLDAVLTKDGHTMYVTDYVNNRIRKITF